MARASLRDSLVLAALAVLGIVTNFAAAFGLGEGLWGLFGALLAVSLVILGISLRVAGVEFGGPELSCEQHLGEAIKSLPSLVIIGIGHVSGLAVPPVEFPPAMTLPVFLVQITCHLVLGLNVRGAGLLVLALAFTLEAALLVAGFFPPGAMTTSGVSFVLSVAFCCALSICTKYMRDQRLVFCISHIQVVAGVLIDRYFIRKPALDDQILMPCVGVLLIYVMLLQQRRLRNLPPALSTIKFIRFGFIRGDASCSGPIVRRQEMPAGAFGHAGKAMELIPVSHRWLDRDTCDAQTPDFPTGLRLGAMRRALNAHFSPTRAEEPSFARRLGRALGRRAVGGYDVVVFFDFAGLPQVPRSDEEEHAFRQCLPHMGMLYSTFPTLVLHEVTPGTHGYLESGWCYCEFETARLGNQLKKYSLDAVGALGALASSSVGERGSAISADRRSLQEEEFMSKVVAKLEHKRFHIPSDADAVRSIISTFALKRKMLDAIEINDMDQLRSVVARLHSQQLAHAALDQPVNAALETPLHVAIRKANVVATRILLDHGAKPSRRNLRGDVPAECFMFARWNRAARLARAIPPQGPFWGEVIGRATPENIAV